MRFDGIRVGLFVFVVSALLAACGGGGTPVATFDQVADISEIGGAGGDVDVATPDVLPDMVEQDKFEQDAGDVLPSEVVVTHCKTIEDCHDLVVEVGDNPCKKVYCDVPSATCVVENMPDGLSCDSGNLCLKDPVCKAGECVGDPIECDDENECTDDSCDPATGCVFENNTAGCEDGNPCTINDTCANGVCVGGENTCGCESDADCFDKDDGNLCNGTLACVEGMCQIDPTTVIVCEEPEDLCTKAFCNPATGLCQTKPVEDGTPCDDSNKCTKGDVCKDGACVGAELLVCDDDNVCTDDSCDPQVGCVFENNTAECDDGNSCTTNDVCIDGKCVGEPTACNCTVHEDCTPFEDGNACNGTLICVDGACVVDPTTVIKCDTSLDNACKKTACNPASGECEVTLTKDGVECDDKNPCTIMTVCTQGECTGGEELTCDDGNLCTADSCDPVKGCVHSPQEGECDDGNACTEKDTCKEGVCLGVPLSCFDDNPCTDDGCDSQTGCVFTNNTLPCDDGNECTQNDKCFDGVCEGETVVCDDQNVCTDDSCDPVTGCIYVNNTAPCDDGDACTINDVCVDGECTSGEAKICDDGNVCTDDSCDPALGCVTTNNTLQCDDGNACTTNDTCAEGVCVGGAPLDCDDQNPCTDDTCDPAIGCVHTNNTVSCDDGNVCTTNDTCAEGVCVGGPPLDCDDGNPCTDDSCVEALGCVNKPNNLACDDGSACTEGDTCIEGQCVGGAAVTCDDNNPCTNDSCDPATGCVFTPNSLPCDDGNACTTNDTCKEGVCVGGPALICDDKNPCTTDSCDPVTGCKYENNTLPCDDGNKCTENDMCVNGTCVPGSPVECDDKNVCTSDTCIPAVGCVFVNNANPCDDSNACTVGDQCKDGECVPGSATLNCDDNNKCTFDECVPEKGCVHTPTNEGAPCNDFNACTVNDKCVNGVCVGEGLSCDDGNVCTDDKCDDPQLGCYHVPNTAPCDDGNICTTGDVCTDGSCIGTIQVDCSDGNVCTDDLCNPKTGCYYENNTAPCDDGNKCTTNDTCMGGKCVGGPLLDCNDGNPCTDDFCHPEVGCVFMNNNDPCDDGSACTTNDTCSDGLCVGGPPPNCDDGNPCTDDSCDISAGCVHTPNTAPCDDGNACTTNDTCVDGKCVAGPLLNCDDGNICTTDSCNPKTGCVNVNNTLPCDDGSKCTTNDTCKDGKCVGGPPLNCDDKNVCTNDSCDPKSGCIYSYNTDPCDDGNKCTTNDACNLGKCVGGPPLNCDDGNPCTTDSCDPVMGCKFVNNNNPCDDGEICTTNDTCSGGSCVGGPPLKCDDNNVCTSDTCVSMVGCVFVPNNNPCEDGNKCTTGDYCQDGKCVPGSQVKCDDFNQCTADSCDEKTGCVYVNVPDGTACDDGNECTTNDMCKNGKCSGVGLQCDDNNPCTDNKCNPAKGECYYVPNTLPCDDGNKCTLNDVCSDGTCVGSGTLDCDDKNPCTDDSCDPKVGCVHTNNTLPCDDGNKCTPNDVCSDGTCVGSGTLDCDDGNVCTTDSCDPKVGCLHTNNTLPCDDGNKCTLNDVCSDGTCVGSGQLVCDDKNPCTDDSCDPATGCVYTDNTLPCDDGNVCTLDDTCSGGVCVGTGTLDCNDNNPCTNDSCDPIAGCQHVNNTLPCDDGNKCTVNDTCSGGTCVPGPSLDCDDGNVCTDDSCDPKVGCMHTNNTLPCDDGNKCTVNDVCSNGTCVGSGALNCEDNNPCTNDSCDPATGCKHVNNTNKCDDQNKCTSDDVCKDGKCEGIPSVICDDYNPCTDDSCDPATGLCVYKLGDSCSVKPLPFYDTIPCKDDLWAFSSAINGVGWAVDNTKNPPGSLTDGCSLNYNDGTAYPGVTSGYATSAFLVDASEVTGSLTLALNVYNGTDPNETGNHDALKIQFSTDGFNTVESPQITIASDNNKAAWVLHAFDISALKGKKFQMRFAFDSGDEADNNGPGWFVEEVNIYAGPIVKVKSNASYLEEFEPSNKYGWQFSAPIGGVGWAIDATPSIPGKLDGSASLNFNDGTDFQSDPVATVAGSALSPVIDLSEVAANQKVSVVFRSWFDTEHVNSRDQRFIRAHTLPFTHPDVVESQLDNTKGYKGWTIESLDVSSFVGKKFRLQFFFNSVNSANNSGRGWFIDNLTVATNPVPVFADGVVCSDPKWTKIVSKTSMWALDATPNPPGFHSSDCSWNFNNGKNYKCTKGMYKVHGQIRSNEFFATAPPAGQKLYLRFNIYQDVEENTNFDVTSVTIVDAEEPDNTIGPYYPARHLKAWAKFSQDISAMQGKTVYIQIEFDSKHCKNNDGAGVFIDDIIVQGQ